MAGVRICSCGRMASETGRRTPTATPFLLFALLVSLSVSSASAGTVATSRPSVGSVSQCIDSFASSSVSQAEITFKRLIAEKQRRVEVSSTPDAANTDVPFTDSVTDLSEFVELNNRVRYPTVINERVRVPGWNFDMMVYYTPFEEGEGCRPGLIFLHPAQVFQVRIVFHHTTSCT